MAAVGASPTYFNYDNFEEIQVSTAGNDPELPVLPNQSTQEVRFRRRWCRRSDHGAFG